MSCPVLVEYTRGKTAFVSQVLKEKSQGLDPQLGLGQVALGQRRFPGHFVATLDAQTSLQYGGRYVADSTRQAERGFFSRIASDFTTRAWVLIPVGVGINFVGGTLVTVLKLPIFLDTIGTILVALLAGPWVAALTGLITNLVLGVADPTLIAYVPVNVAIGLIAGFLALRGWFKTYPKIVASGLIIMLTGVILSAPIVVLVFGGVTSSPSRSALTAFFLATGSEIWGSVLATGIIVEIVDKLISVFVAVFVARAIPERYRPQKAQQTL